MLSRRTFVAAALALLLPAAGACRRDARRPSSGARRAPLIVIGIDGGEWKVIRLDSFLELL